MPRGTLRAAVVLGALAALVGCKPEPTAGDSGVVDAGGASDAGVDSGGAGDAGVDAGPVLPRTLTISPGETPSTAEGLALAHGGDADTAVVLVGSPAVSAVRTGNGAALPSPDGNTVGDHYVQFAFPDAVLFDGAPTTSVLVSVEYLDTGTDVFFVQYDGQFDPFTITHQVVKTNSGAFKTARFMLSDVRFANRVNGGDLRIDDRGDGAETVRAVTFTVLPRPHLLRVDACGANPFDDLPDSDAIGRCIDQAVSGDVVLFTSAGGQPGYRGYLIDKTVFLVGAPPARARLTFTSTDPKDRALLQATADLKGFVVRLFARSALSGAQQGQVDDVTVAHLHLDGNRGARFCFGPNGTFDGVDDNWGSVRADECGPAGDAWCLPGTMALSGAFDEADGTQDFRGHPDAWSTGLLADDLLLTNTTCGTALGLSGADSVVARSTIDTAGDHVHGAGCAKVKPGEPVGDWSDGMTIAGPFIQIVDNTVLDPSDVGIVLFGGHQTAVAGNVVRATAGNHGAFAGIALHAWAWGENGFGLIARNVVTNAGDSTCGGLHVGINLGPHMWGGACAVNNAGGVGLAVGAGACPDEPSSPAGALCPATGRCQQWAWMPDDAPFSLEDNQVTGAHINYLIEGLSNGASGLREHANAATTARATDWGAAAGCNGVSWAPSDFIAHHPARTGWADVRVHCER